jgi:hypothetical protein
MSAQRLTGVVVGAGGSLAILGGRVVRSGSPLLGGEARVAEIDRSGVTVSFPGGSLRVELEPLRPAAAWIVGEGQGGAPDAAADGTGSARPAAVPSPGPGADPEGGS